MRRQSGEGRMTGGKGKRRKIGVRTQLRQPSQPVA
jgi:hypothetical protein